MIEGTPLAVHRCRFVDYTPSAVTALCFPPLRLPSVKGKQSTTNRKPLKFGTLAVGRGNGNIEICEWTGTEQEIKAPQAWVVRKTLAGPYPSKVDSLAFAIKFPDSLGEDEVPTVSNLRLFSAGGSSELVEWDLQRACVRRTVSSQGGAIWAISPNPASSILALGCEDGSIRLLSIEADTLTHLRRFDRVKSRILSIAWGPPVPRETAEHTGGEDLDSDDDADDWSDSWLVAGCSDSCLRKWDVGNGRVLDRMATDKVRGERTLVWAVGVLGDGTIVSGDSMGIVKFWDPRTCTQLDSFQGHAADVLCLTISPEGTAVYTSGVDQKITQYSHVKTSRAEASSSLLARSPARWVQSTSRRMHSHDVRALAIWPPYSPVPPSHRRKFPIDVAPVLVSGGLDMSVVTTPAALPTSTVTRIINPLATSTPATFEDSYHRRLAYNSGPYNSTAIHLARDARLLLCMRDAGLSVWRILRKQNSLDVDEMDAPRQDVGWERVLDMDLNANTTLTASAISSDGRWVAVADWYETKLFYMEEEVSTANSDLKPRRIRDFAAILLAQLPPRTESTGASSLLFSPDSSRLFVASAMSSFILVVDLDSDPRHPRILRRFGHHQAEAAADADADARASASSDDDTAPPPTHRLALATITRMAVSPDGRWLASSDERGRTHVANLAALQHHAQLPSFPAAVHALAFDPAAPTVLVLGLANNSIQVYDAELRTFPRWARGLNRGVPERFAHLHDPILGVAFDPASVGPSEPAEGGAPRAPQRNALFWGATWLCRVKLDAETGWGGFEQKRRRDAAPGRRQAAHAPAGEGDQLAHPQSNFRVVTHYRPVLFVDFVGRGELVVVERPLVDVLSRMPPAFFKPKYGRT
ncbi:hypothetical protein POSPLADRAFT_1176689 [Postia placenta MAD-698-R-SB12]|uniref:Uncharacterized protein n=1 Tax=Postia placenta MAD-698-R-SB12 TaxID=670580 RepID=A0A1X6NGL5_9APHY|nr:hypothetical protein POSPLADRAFT_1176689 [Postia placenta MAD-698-R-SB12]OSX67759.1 hypothetical protein POSPLADRAFT_1176689 [Postia placenta MAD-698-R-SB12]